MPWGRTIGFAAAVVAVLWSALDAGFGGSPAAPPITSLALVVLALLFGVGAWVMQVAGRAERAPLLAGLAIGAGAYAIVRLTLPG